MIQRRIAIVLVLLAATVVVLPSAVARELTLEERVEVQAAIERVYYSHQIDTRHTFEEAVPREVIERKVRKYLQQSAALRDTWRTPVTAPMLRAEMWRIARQTRMPERLRELYAAVDDDPFLFQECIARPALVGRLIRKYIKTDSGIAETVSDLDPHSVPAVASPLEPFSQPGAGGAIASTDVVESCPAAARWDNGALDDAPDGRELHVSIWTGSLMIVWGGQTEATDLGSGHRYDPATDTWTGISTLGAPEARRRAAAAWTGTELVVWGGLATNDFGASRDLDTGARYDPLADLWTAISMTGAPAARGNHTAVWTGSEVIFWGGGNSATLDTGGRYDPATDSWRPTATGGAASRREHTAVWTGEVMIVWGGYQNGFTELGSGGRYNPANDSWDTTSFKNVPSPRVNHTAVWTGDEMIVWGGGRSGTKFKTGARYSPRRDRWSATEFTGAPAARLSHVAVWTGNEMLIWGGEGEDALLSGGRYNPASDAWSPMSELNAPPARWRHTAVWADNTMIVWGGYGLNRNLNTGGKFDPAADSWTQLSTGEAPPESENHTAVWTGNLLLVWGGSDGSELATGGRYDAVLDTWSPTTTVNAPTPRSLHTTVWTGEEMLVWGGSDPPTDTGGRYEPIADSWMALPTTGAPAARNYHTAVWTGNEMIIWGGVSGDDSVVNTGGRYDPATVSWGPALQTTGAPSERERHTAVWTGREMIIWGGAAGPAHRLVTGGRYNPSTDKWIPTSLPPSGLGPVWEHTAIWTGAEMIVWGGGYPSFDTGGRYDPVTDSWIPTPLSNAPEPRARHGAIWTGSRMLIWGGFRQLSSSRQKYPMAGGLYDPVSHSWTSLATDGSPPGRHRLSLNFDGNYALAWGGSHGQAQGTNLDYIRGGGRYAVDTDGDGLANVCDDDDDGDGALDGDDCAPHDAATWAIPGEVRDLRLTHNRTSGATTLEWDEPLAPGGSTVRYDVLRANDPAGFPGADCLLSDITARSASDNDVLATGALLSYLIRTETGCGAGSLGTGSDGSERSGPPCL